MAKGIFVDCHLCGTFLGEFIPLNDNGGVVMRCRGCGELVSVLNGTMTEILEHPDEYDPNDRIRSYTAKVS